MGDTSDYYWSEQDFNGFGDLWYLIIPQQTGTAGGGDFLLGSVLPRVQDTSFFSFNHYPIPEDFMQSQYVLNELKAKATTLNIPANPTNQIMLAGAKITQGNSGSGSFSGSTGQIPGLPVSLGIQLSYDTVSSIAISIGSAIYSYIPTQYLSKLYQACGGNSKNLSLAYDISGQNICDCILLSDNYGVTVTTNSDLSADLNAKLTTLPPSASLSLSNKTNNSFTLQVSGTKYLIGFGTSRWNELDPT
jgi:hypothetical protein